MCEIRQRTRMVGAFSDRQSALMLVATRLRHIADTKWGTRRYLDTERLRDLVAHARAIAKARSSQPAAVPLAEHGDHQLQNSPQSNVRILTDGTTF